MASVHLAIGAVLFANEDTILLTDGTAFMAPAWMHLPMFPAGTTAELGDAVLARQMARKQALIPQMSQQ